MPEEPSQGSSDLGSDAALLGLEDDGLDPDPEIGESSTPMESESEEEPEGETKSEEAEPEKPAEEEPKEETKEEEAEPTEQEAAEPEAPEKFSFLDREYDNKEDAEHALKSYLGQVSAKDKQIEELTGLLKQLNDRQTEFMERQDKGPEPAKGKAEAEESKPSSFWDAIDFDMLEEEIENHGLRRGMEYLALKMDEHIGSVKEDVRQEMLSGMAPFQAWQEQMAEFNESFAYFDDLSRRVDDDKKPLYPELSADDPENQAFSQRVAERWLKTFTPEERKRLGSYGAHIAYVLQKADEGSTAPPPEPPEPPPEPPKESRASEAFDRLNRQTNQGANQGVLTGSSSVKPTSRRTTNDIVNQELTEYGENAVEPILGI